MTIWRALLLIFVAIRVFVIKTKANQFDPCWDFRDGHVEISGAALSQKHVYFAIKHYMYRFPINSFNTTDLFILLNDPEGESQREKIDLRKMFRRKNVIVKGMFLARSKDDKEEYKCFRDETGKVECYSDQSKAGFEVNDDFLGSNQYLILNETGNGIKLTADSDKTTIALGTLDKTDMTSMHFATHPSGFFMVYKSTEDLSHNYFVPPNYQYKAEDLNGTKLSQFHLKEPQLFSLGPAGMLVNKNLLFIRRDFIFIYPFDIKSGEMLITNVTLKAPELFFTCDKGEARREKQKQNLVYALFAMILVHLAVGLVIKLFCSDSKREVKMDSLGVGAISASPSASFASSDDRADSQNSPAPKAHTSIADPFKSSSKGNASNSDQLSTVEKPQTESSVSSTPLK